MAHVVDTYELSPMQQGMLVHALSSPGAGVDIEQIVITLHERLEIPTFERAMNDVIRRHPVLRTQFRWGDVDEPCQEVLAEAHLAATVADWSDLTPELAGQRFTAYLRTDRRRDFDLSHAPLLRLFVAQFPGDETRVVWTFHHMLGDGRSYIVLREWFEFYDAALRGETLTLPTSRPYRDYIEWRRTLDLDAAEAFWRAELGTFRAPTPFGIDTPRTVGPDDDRFGAHQRRLTRELSDQLRAAASRAGVTVNTMIQAAWAFLLHRYSGETDIVFGATRTGRWTGFSGADAMIGLLINTLPVRVDVDDDAELESWLHALRSEQIARRPYEHTPLAAVQAWSGVGRGTPLFESMVVFDYLSLDACLQLPGRHFEYIGQTNFPLALLVYGDDEMLFRLEYSTERFSAEATARMFDHLVTVLGRLSDGDATHVRDLDPVGPEERAVLVGGSGMVFEPGDVTLHAGFARQVAACPEAVAVCMDTAAGYRSLTYAELDARAEALAGALRGAGVGRGMVVGIRLHRSPEVVIAILAVLKAGAAYLPLDPVYPPERVGFMLTDTAATVVLTHSDLADELAGLPVRCVCLDHPLPTAADTAPEPGPGAGTDLAYVMYTSGSTGQPKGVQVTHHNVLRLFAATDHWFGFGPTDVWTLFHSYAFDVSVWEMWGALLHGGRLVIVDHDTSRDPAALRALLQRQQVSVLCQTPSAFTGLSDTDRTSAPADFALRYIIFAGEALPLHSLAPWIDRYGDTAPQLINMYGITETTVHATYRRITATDVAAHTGSLIGQPIPDLRLYLLDRHGQPVPIGVPGEIHLAGPGVSNGYLNRPDLTAQRFLTDPFHGGPMYRSGDLARRLDNGDIEYLGRIDHQVKIRGFRIELGEIETALAAHPAIHHVAVIDRPDPTGQKHLIAYLVTDTPTPTLTTELRHHLRTHLPEYMIPAHFHYLPTLPLTPNGKLDRNNLPTPQPQRAVSNPYSAPRNPAERAIADVWKSVLHIDDVGLDDHFFELGGDSLLTIRVHAQLSERLHRDLPMVALLQYPTVRSLAQHLAGGSDATAAADATMNRARQQRAAYARHRDLARKG
ncbi:MAG TPA: amino acid adenylation domain-containing protein [Mycobacterium sp.]|nr:amino acid adenylation domain-containing protein [Mycobacterium sp.]